MPDTVPGKWGQRNTVIELCSKPVSRGVYAGERLSLGGTGKAVEGQSWSPTGLARCDRPG
jgi:hypothetical protein